MLTFEVIGQGATTTIYRDGATAIKYYENTQIDEVEREAERQRFAINSGLSVPCVFGVRMLEDGKIVLDMEYINGKPLIHHGMGVNECRKAIDTLVELQILVHQVDAKGLPKQTQRLYKKIKYSSFLNNKDKDRLLRLLSELDAGKENLCHGDFHPLNILCDGEKHWIIDWVDATAGNPYADACRTHLILQQYMPCSAEIYLKAFCNKTKAKPENILVWLPIIAAGRLHENSDDRTRLWLLEQTKNT